MNLILIAPSSNRRSVANRFRALFGAGLLFAVSGMAASDTELAMVEETFDCRNAVAAGNTDKAALARELATHTFSLQHLGCAARTLKSVADRNHRDLAAQLEALDVYAEYMFFLDEDARFTFGYMVEHFHDIDTATVADLKLAATEFRGILKRAQGLAAEAPEVLYFNAVGAGMDSEAIPLLKRVIAANSRGLNGAAYRLLGEIYYSLPDLLGGNLNLGIENLRKALEFEPDNPRTIRLLGRALEEDGNIEQALRVLARLDNLAPEKGRLQSTADELRNGIDLAERLGARELSENLRQKREALLAAHPYLMTRRLTSLLMHSGEEHPLEAERSGSR